jgi:uncharacterized protein
VTVPPEQLADLAAVVTRHGQAVVAGDQPRILADFRPDRTALLIASARLPAGLTGSEVLKLEPEPDGLVAALIRYTAADGQQAVLRSRWMRDDTGGWRVTQVRNLPETPPWLPAEPPAPGDPAGPHWDGLRAHELRILRCARCERWIWPPRPICPGCRGFELSWRAVEPAGRIYSWTRTWQPFAPEVSGHLPYVVVLVELPQAGGRRLLGVLRDAGQAGVAIGADVDGEFEDPPDGAHAPLLRWRLTAAGGRR